MKTIDLNCDVGEGINNEELLMPFLSSCNIACGMHAGDESTMRRVVDLAASHKVAVGAHPSFKDRENFGRKEMDLELEEITNLVKIQILKLKEICEEKGTSLHHVKPHGALYNQAAKSSEISEAIVRAVEEVDPSLQLYGLADSEMQSACSGRIPFIAEGFADRKYSSKNELKPRLQGGLISSMDEVESHLNCLLARNEVRTDKGFESLRIETLCLHGDTPDAHELIERIVSFVKKIGFKIQAP